MIDWTRRIQRAVDVIDEQLKQGLSDEVTLHAFAGSMHYSPYHVTRKFRQVTGLSFREYLHKRKLSFALIELRDSGQTILEIAVKYGFSSHEAFSRAFKELYGVTPGEYRKNPRPVVLRTKITVLDCYLMENGEIGMEKTMDPIRIYHVQIPAHKFLHVKNYESDGYWDFWEKMETEPGKDCDTICGLLDSIKGKLDGDDREIGTYSGQIVGYLNEADGRAPEAYGIRLPADYAGPIPEQMELIDVSENEYLVFEHGPFDYETQFGGAYEALLKAIDEYSYANTGYKPDTSPGRIGYYYCAEKDYLKKVFPIIKDEPGK